MIELIGGILVEGTLRRDVVLRPLSGAIELVLAELAASRASQPDKVTVYLAETIESIGGQPVDAELAAGLAVGDRQHLVRQIGAGFGPDLVWLTGTCAACGSDYDIPVRQRELPVKAAGPGFPECAIEVEGRPVRVRTPCGADQSVIAGMDADTGTDVLLRRLTDVGGELTAEMSQRIESAIEDLSPEVALQAAAQCPECDVDVVIDVDPYVSLGLSGGEIFDDIHVLASRYHWSEAEILAMPRARRKGYLGRIERDRGLIGGEMAGGSGLGAWA